MILSNIKPMSISFFVGFAISLYITSKYKDAVWENAINAQKIEAQRLLQEATETVVRIEREQNEVRARLEVKHVESQKEMDNLLIANRALSATLGGLRDPGSRGASCKNTNTGTAKTASSTANSTPTNKLSNEASEFLLELARDADRAADYARTCHDWARSLKGKK